jgi:arylsulfatase A-like enzyme
MGGGKSDSDAGRAKRIGRRQFLAAGGALTASALGVEGLTSTATATGARIGAYRRTPRPNILVIVVDELRTPIWFGAGARGAPVLPPTMAALESAGASFRRHYTVSNDCTPARSAMVTGLYTHQTGCMITGTSTLNSAFPTWGTMLREHGYSAWWFGKFHLDANDRWWNRADGPRALERYGFEGGTFPSPNGAPGQGWRVDGRIADQFQHWLNTAAASNGGWCTTVSFVNPHDIAWWYRWSNPYPHEASAPSVVAALPSNFETPTELAQRAKPRVQTSLIDTANVSFGPVPYDGPAVVASWLPFFDLYVKVQLAVDGHIRAVLDALARHPKLMANTVVILTSDHGEYGGSHGLRGKGAGVYDEGIRVPLIVTDFSGDLGVTPGLRDQLSSSVDLAPLLLTIAGGSDDWRSDARYAQIAGRADLLAIARDPGAPGRDYVLHATDEVVTEFALRPYAANAPLHITALITPTHKYATYTNWRHGTIEPIPNSQEVELYDHTTSEGRLEIANQTGRSPHEDRLRSTLEHATRAELRAPLPAHLAGAQEAGLHQYQVLANLERSASADYRMNTVEKIVQQFENQLP